MSPTALPWKTHEKRTLLNHSKYLRVEEHTLELPDGQIIANWPWVICPNASIVLAQNVDGQYCLFRQGKYAVDGLSLAPVGGMIEPGEAPLTAAKRELLEEMGYAAEEWIALGSHVLHPNQNVSTVHLFFARGAHKVAEPDSDDLEEQELVVLSKEVLRAALYAGEIKVASWATCVSMALGIG